MKIFMLIKWIAKGGLVLIKLGSIIACLIWFAASNSKLAAAIKGKKKKPASQSSLNLDFINIPEVGKKIQQSFRKPVFF